MPHQLDRQLRLRRIVAYSTTGIVIASALVLDPWLAFVIIIGWLIYTQAWEYQWFRIAHRFENVADRAIEQTEKALKQAEAQTTSELRHLEEISEIINNARASR